MAGNGVLLARAGLVAHVYALAAASGVVMAVMALLIWHHGQSIYRERQLNAVRAHHQPTALQFLTGATVLTAAVAITMTFASLRT